MSERYADILQLPRPKSKTRTPMPLMARAAQFAPFAALTGHEAAIRETARLTQRRVEPDEDTIARINERLRYLKEAGDCETMVTVTYFLPDEKKDGGTYLTAESRVKAIDSVSQQLILADGREIPMKEILSLDLQI